MAVRRGCKVYVDVGAEFSDEGELIPKYLIWEDGTRYEIDRVISHERCASRKNCGPGILYLCMVRGQNVRLFYEENYRWFVEARTS